MTDSFRKVGWSFVMILFCGGISHAAMPNMTGGSGKEYKPGELIVKFRSGGEGRRGELHRRHGSRKIREFASYSMERVKLRDGATVEEAIREFETDPEVEYAEPNFIVQALVVPGDPSFTRLWGMNRINAPAAWDTTTGSAEVVVAVLDSGIDAAHSDLKANLWVNTLELNGIAGVDDDNNGIIDDINGYNAISGNGNIGDDVGHGTHVAGTIGATGNNSVGVAGVNWNVRIMACKFLGATGGTSADAIECLQYVALMKRRGVNIVATNNSWGGGGYSRSLHDAIAAQEEILFIVAAGNDGTDSDVTPTYPASYGLPNVVAVAATTSADSLATFSQRGQRTVHVGAPGSAIYSTFPGNSYATQSGTSMAAPHVTGLAALIKAARPTADWRGIRNLLLAGGTPLPSLDGKTVTGRQIDAFGSLTCLDNRLFSALAVPASVTPGASVTVSALSINCDAPLGPVTVALSSGVQYELKDDGISPDLAAGDGIFTVTVTPANSSETFSFSSPAGSKLAAALSAPLTVTFAGSGSGSVSSNPSGISCTESPCNSIFPLATQVILTSSPAPGSTFAGWSGACSNQTGDCTVVLDTEKGVTANFSPALINGVCGSSNGGTFTSAPSANLCTAGTPSPVTGSGQWTWSCQGANGGASSNCSGSSYPADSTAPVISAFTLPAAWANLTIPISSLAAGDNIGIASWCLTESGSATGCAWKAAKPAAHTFGGGSGQRTLYAFARDAAGNASTAVSSGINIILGDSSGGAGQNNGVPSAADALDALRISVGARTPTATELVRADIAPIVNGMPQPDGRVDIQDVIVILRRVVGLPI